MDTLRQRIARLLKSNSLDAWQLAESMGIHEKELLAHLPHVARSASGRGEKFRVRPAVCLDCGFEFKERRRLDPPGKCPKCKQERIQGPWYHIDAPPKRTGNRKRREPGGFGGA